MEAIKAEAEYRWLDAAKAYEQSLQTMSLENSSVAECWRKIGFCLERASRQARDIEELKTTRNGGIRAFEQAAILFHDDKNQGRSDECKATAEYLRSWTIEDRTTKIKTLKDCIALSKTAIDTLKTPGNEMIYGQTATLLSNALYELLLVTSSGEEKNEIAREGIDYAENAISSFSKLNCKDDYVQALSISSILAYYAANISNTEDERKKFAEKSVCYAAKAIEISNEIENTYSKVIARLASVSPLLVFTDDIEVPLKNATEMLALASKTRDNYFLGMSSYLLAMVIDWKVAGEENPDKRKEQCDEIIKYTEDGIRFLDLVFRDTFIAECFLFAMQTYSTLGSDFAVTLAEKLVYSKKAVTVGKKGLEYALRSGSPDSMSSILHGLSKAYYYDSNLESQIDPKSELLREALGCSKDLIQVVKTSFSSNIWMLGVSEVYAAEIETDLARVESIEKNKINILKEAILDMENGVQYCKKWITTRAVPSVITIIAGYEDNLGAILEENFQLTKKLEDLTRANKVYSEAAEDYKTVDIPSRVAESYWKIGRNLDQINDYDLAARNFENAFGAYKAASQKINQFNDFFLDYASYMKAWSEIEQAKKAHNEGNYDKAVQHFEATSKLLRQAKSWMYLSLNYYAWSILEQAEDLSKKEQSKECIAAFENAAKFLQESKRILKIKLQELDKLDEKNMVKKLIDSSEVRADFINGRIAIEEGKVSYKDGNHIVSAENYKKASEIFQRITLTDSEQAKRDALPLIYLCRAWEKMMLAEARGSPILYEEASDLFQKAKENSFSESTSLMALGHSSFCKALESVTEFEITRTMTMYEQATQQLEAAADFYLKAGCDVTSDYAKATQRLFDAYVFMETAKHERDSVKKTKYYENAEKVLQASADFFNKANYQNKTQQVGELLKKVKEDRKLSLSLNEIFHAPTITSSTGSFLPISASEEVAVGLERFEHADIQARLVQLETEFKVGETTALTIQLVNVGREPVSLTRIENILPTGLQLVSKPDYCVFEDMQLTMRGKRLDPLRAEEIRLTVRSFKKGSVEIRPTITCVDAYGRQITFNPEPASFNVTGIALPGRVTTGYSDLDNLLYGGIPENFSVVLASPSSDERELLIKKFLEAGAKKGEITFFITTEPGYAANLAEEYPVNFYLFLCNPRADVMVKSLPNIFKLKGIESLTDIDIALIKSFRMLNQLKTGPKRACIEIISDVLLQHHAVTTRRWLSGILADFRSRGFTTLGIVNLQMHPPEEVQATLGLFEGEIRVTERDVEDGVGRFLRIRKLYNQRYLENEIVLTRDRLES
jgi:uncharacterized repeat protein (TIGR01451 family)